MAIWSLERHKSCAFPVVNNHAREQKEDILVLEWQHMATSSMIPCLNDHPIYMNGSKRFDGNDVFLLGEGIALKFFPSLFYLIWWFHDFRIIAGTLWIFTELTRAYLEEDFRRSGDHCGEACMLLSLAEAGTGSRLVKGYLLGVFSWFCSWKKRKLHPQ